MATVYSDAQFRTIFQSPFELSSWIPVLRDFFKASELKVTPESVLSSDETAKGVYLGNKETEDGFRIGLFHYEISLGSVVNKRVGLRNLVRTFINPQWGVFDAALVTFNSGDHWRLSFVSDIKGEETTPRRYTYVFGNSDFLYKTPIKQFAGINKSGVTFAAIKEAFSVESLSDSFFEDYRKHYADFVQFVTGKRYKHVGSKWIEEEVAEPHFAIFDAFKRDDRKVRDYIKKLMGRITFLHFLQRKGWMNNDMNYMQNLYKGSHKKDNYLDAVLEPLFFGILNTKQCDREEVFKEHNWDIDLLKEWETIPYLNGGLFERDEEDEPDTVFPAEFFERLFDFFGNYNFTVDENDPNDAEVGVDPEMLGKIFENLLEDNKDKGAFYTPKEIVQYMCREALSTYLSENTKIDKEFLARFVANPEELKDLLQDQQKKEVLEALKNVKICDPAIGSGAFPMGLLKELFNCRRSLESESFRSPASIKKEIIEKNIYGVDIEKGAVDIARLRFWLSIVVDEAKPTPLPNLDYKIMQGNSLIESFMGVDLSKLSHKKANKKEFVYPELWGDPTSNLQKIVSVLLEEYYSCSNHNYKIDLQQRIAGAVYEQLKARKINDSTIQRLQELNISENQYFFLWHTWFNDVFFRNKNKNGFDIVIANPPYIDSETMTKVMPEERREYAKLYTTAKGNWDMYIPFIERGISLCCNKGVFAYIIPNKIIAAKYAEHARGYLIQGDIVEIRDYSKVDVFSNADVYPCTIIGSRRTAGPTRFSIMDGRDSIASSVLVQRREMKKCPFWDIHFRAKEEIAVLSKMLRFPILEEHGALSVQSAATVADAYNLKEIIEDVSELDDSVKIINTGTIDRYKSLWGAQSMKYLKDNYTYPRVSCSRLAAMNDTRRLQALAPKIIVAGMTKVIEAVFDEGQTLAAKSTSVILSPDKQVLRSVLAVLNSKLMSFFVRAAFSSLKMSGGFLNISKRELLLLPVPDFSAAPMDELVSYTESLEIAISNNSELEIERLEAKINETVYSLYGLTEEDIALVEKSE